MTHPAAASFLAAMIANPADDLPRVSDPPWTSARAPGPVAWRGYDRPGPLP